MDAETQGQNWLICKVENGKYTGFGGPHKQEEIIDVFLSRAKANT